jgi:hypothetical protein
LCIYIRDRRRRDRMVVGFTMQSLPITTDVVSSEDCSVFGNFVITLIFEFRPGQGVQHYVIKFVSDLRQVRGFLLILRFPPPIKITAAIQLKYC